jgi:hypothetical protein
MVDTEKALRFLAMMNETSTHLEIEHNNYEEPEAPADNDAYEIAEEQAREECGLTLEETQEIYDNLEQYQ